MLKRICLSSVLLLFYFLLKPLWSGTDYPVASYANVPLLEHYDLIVAGAEPEGIAAAISGARNGLKTLLVDVRPEVGGLMTRGWLSNIDMNYGPNKEILNKGIFLEFYEGVGGDAFDPAVASQVFNSMIAKEKNLQVFLNAADIQPLSVNNTMIGLRILPQKGDAREVKAWRVIDATCDADIAAAAGVPYSLGFSDCGRPGEYMATTLVFRLKGISSLDWMKLVLNLKLSEEPNNGVKNQSAWGFSQIMKRYQPTDNRLMVRGLNICRLKDNRVLVNALLVLGMDPLDYNSRKEGRILAEKEIPLLTKYISKNIPGLSSVMPDATAHELYIRQSRNIYGLYRLSINDVLENRDFKDRIAMGSYPVDIQATSQSFRGDVIGKPKLYSVPFRCLVPKEVNNLLVVGRSASFDSLSAGSTRVIPVGMATGQAAGAAAALSIEKGLPFNEMSGDLNVIHELQKRLNAQGMKLYSFSYEIPCGNHWAYPGLRFVRKWGMASGGYTNNYRLDEAMSVMSFINTLSRVTGTKIPTGVMIYPASEKLTLTNASQIICCFKNLSVPKPETLQYLKLAGFWEPDLLKHIQNEGKISKGAGYMIVLRYADWPGQTSINQGGQN